MTSKPILGDTSKLRELKRLGLGLLIFILLFVALLAAAPWLKATFGGSFVGWVGRALAILAMGYAYYFAIRRTREMDEVQKASTEFAVRWGWSAGVYAYLLLMMLPPLQQFMTDLVIEFGGSGGTVDRSVVVFAMTTGAMGVMLLQTIAIIVHGLFWWKSKR